MVDRDTLWAETGFRYRNIIPNTMKNTRLISFVSVEDLFYDVTLGRICQHQCILKRRLGDDRGIQDSKYVGRCYSPFIQIAEYLRTEPIGCSECRERSAIPVLVYPALKVVSPHLTYLAIAGTGRKAVTIRPPVLTKEVIIYLIYSFQNPVPTWAKWLACASS